MVHAIARRDVRRRNRSWMRNGKMVAYQVDHYMPAMQDDRPVGAVLAGLPTMPAPSEKGVSSAPP